MFLPEILVVVVLASHAAAHGYIETFTLDGIAYKGYNRWKPSYGRDAIGWSYTTEDEGPELNLTSTDFACRRGSRPAANYGTVAAGGNASFYWTSDDKVVNPNGWPDSHHGAVLAYLAPYAADAGQLRWTKIAEAGLVSGPANARGVWATDLLRRGGGLANATIPASVAPGRYVVRSELIALHRANVGQPEFYMQCASVLVTGAGTDDLSRSGVPTSQLYSLADAQLFGFDIYDNRGLTWKIPGPPLYRRPAAATAAPAPAYTQPGGASRGVKRRFEA